MSTGKGRESTVFSPFESVKESVHRWLPVSQRECIALIIPPIPLVVCEYHLTGLWKTNFRNQTSDSKST